MKLEELIALGISDEQAKKVLDLHKSAIDGNYIPKATFESERQKVKDRDAMITERDQQISDLSKFKGDAEQLQEKIDELTNQNAEDRKAYEEKMQQMEIEATLRLEVVDKVHNFDDILPKLDVSKIAFKDGKVVSGLAEQLELIKESNPYYFKDPGESNDNKGLPGGWRLSGKEPPEGSGSTTGNAAADFGKSLAQSQIQNSSTMQKASETYFQ